MKSLKGMKRNASSLENKKLTDLKSIQGGLYADKGYSRPSTLTNSEGCTDTDYYNSDGTYKGRGWLCVG